MIYNYIQVFCCLSISINIFPFSLLIQKGIFARDLSVLDVGHSHWHADDQKSWWWSEGKKMTQAYIQPPIFTTPKINKREETLLRRSMHANAMPCSVIFYPHRFSSSILCSQPSKTFLFAL